MDLILSILDRLLKKRGIESVEELSEEEKATFEGYRAVLSKKELDISDIKEFITIQLGMIEAKWKDINVEQARKEQLLPYFTAYKSILDVMSVPQIERKTLEDYLTNEINRV